VAKYQNRPTLKSVAARRGQTLAQLIDDWAVLSVDELVKRCKREGVEYPTDFTFVHSKPNLVEKPITKNALVDLVKKSEELPAKKVVKGKLTPDESVTSVKHDGVDTDAPAWFKDPA